MEIGDWIGRSWTNYRTLMLSWQESRVPILRAVGSITSPVRQHDKCCEVVVHASQAVADPSTDAGPGELPRAAMHPERTLVVVRVVRLHRADHAEVIDDTANVREEIADFDAALAARLELPDGPFIVD